LSSEPQKSFLHIGLSDPSALLLWIMLQELTRKICNSLFLLRKPLRPDGLGGKTGLLPKR